MSVFVWILHISKNGYSTTSLSKMFQYVITFKVKMFGVGLFFFFFFSYLNGISCISSCTHCLCLFTKHHSKDFDFLFFIPNYQVLITTNKIPLNLFPRVNSPSFLSLSLYVTFSKTLIIFVTCCSLDRVGPCLFCTGKPKTAPNSLTSAE